MKNTFMKIKSNNINYIKFKLLLISILMPQLFSCTFNVDITYRLDRKQELIKEEGYIIECKEQDNAFNVTIFTPLTWDKEFYYGYLGGKRSDKEVSIDNIKLLFLNTLDTLNLEEIRKERTYVFKSKNLANILSNNKRLKLEYAITDLKTGKTENKLLVLKRKKKIYSVGTFPHM